MTSVAPHGKAASRLRELPDLLFESDRFAAACEALRAGSPATFDNVWGSAVAAVVAAIRKRVARPLLIIAPTAEAMDDLADDFATFSDERIERFPPGLEDDGASRARDEAYGTRIRLLKCWLRGDAARVVVTCPHALLQKVPESTELLGSSRVLRTGEKLEVDSFRRWLVENGYQAMTAVELPGEFSVRGGIVDLFAHDWPRPVRIELFDDEIESLRQFDVATQRTVSSVDSIELTVLSTARSGDAHVAAALPPDTCAIWLEPTRIEEQAAHLASLVEIPGVRHDWADVRRSLASLPVATIAALAAGSLGVECRLPIESLERFDGDLDALRATLDRVAGEFDVRVVTRTEGEIERVAEILQATRIAATGRLTLSVGCIHAGFRLLSHRVLVVGCDQLFRRGELRRLPKRRLGKAIDSFLDLREGDLVVHLAHGIGRYRGLQVIAKGGCAEEHLELEFDKGTRLFVPATRIDLVQKYVGGSKTRPRLAQIGGKMWVRQKKAAEQAVTDMAAEMLVLQAQRRSRPGIAMRSDTTWQLEFENAFPYRETPDQNDAIRAVKSDMQTARPMDRLICGDVGFGKTEVAMRAAFKAVENGYQVAVLVPTTVLAEQHFETFRERMAEFPLEIAKLSRFCTPEERKRNLVGLRDGKVDIVVGTHRLASKDVQFANLGLVVIDEEQRFGVEVKERLKANRPDVDVLTLSATPIPRTLHMSLVGVRDISNLETPPEERMAVETRVTRWNDDQIRHAILRELNRDGQIYFVHNRVQDIGLVEHRLKQIVPELRIGIGHAQMSEQRLERVMRDFIAHRFDLLLATTIIESGLDIPNANTIFIDEAERYGLADLHQLRGRVGRYKHQAYAYLLVDTRKHVNPIAAKRLRAIEEYSQMGAGFSIAMRDLEIRGAGNLLGTEQSGHIATVGYELYCQLLENAVRTLRQMPPKLTLHVDVDLPHDAYLPTEYVADPRHRIDLYRRLTRVESYDQLPPLREELVDRFGSLPPAAERLLEVAELRLDAAVWQIDAIFIEEPYLVFRSAHAPRLEQLKRANRWPLRVVDQQSAYLRLGEDQRTPDHLLAIAKSVLRPGS